MPTAVRPTPISGENSASVMAAPPTSGDQPINIAHVPTPSPPGAPDRDCAAGVHCMADRTADDRHAPRSRACRRGDERRGRGDEGEEGGGGGSVELSENDALSLERPQDKFSPESDVGEEEDSAAAL